MALDRFSSDPVLSQPAILGNFASWTTPSGTDEASMFFFFLGGGLGETSIMVSSFHDVLWYSMCRNSSRRYFPWSCLFSQAMQFISFIQRRETFSEVFVPWWKFNSKPLLVIHWRWNIWSGFEKSCISHKTCSNSNKLVLLPTDFKRCFSSPAFRILKGTAWAISGKSHLIVQKFQGTPIKGLKNCFLKKGGCGHLLEGMYQALTILWDLEYPTCWLPFVWLVRSTPFDINPRVILCHLVDFSLDVLWMHECARWKIGLLLLLLHIADIPPQNCAKHCLNHNCFNTLPHIHNPLS